MGRITSSTGLATGFPIQETVDKLIALQARPRDLLITQTKKIDQQRTAITSLTAQLIAIQINSKRFAAESVYKQRTVTSGDSTLLDAVSTGTPEVGQFQFTPIRKAQSQQLQSSRFTSNTQPIGAGSFSFRFGGQVDHAAELDLLGGGAGFSRGKIRVTDRSGATADIDLRYARDIDDVLDAINENTTIKVQASAHNDTLRLTDQTGQTLSNLKVEELNGTTAASLGLAGINVAANTATGQDVLSLFEDLTLQHLNDGLGVRFDGALGDLRVTLRDGSRVNLDFDKLTSTGTNARGTTTAANGVNAQLTFTAVEPGPELDGVAISFIDDGSITAGSEVVEYDALAKTLAFRIDAGATTADQIIAALGRDPEASADFIASRATLGDGTGIVTSADTATATGPQASGTTAGGGGPQSKLFFKARTGGGEFDNVAIRFVDNAGVSQGNETVAYDDSNPLNKQLIFQIDAGNTRANDIVAALTGDPAANALFSVEHFGSSLGTDPVLVTDTAYTSGGALVAASTAADEITLKQVLDALNNAAPGKVSAGIGPNSQLVLTDLTVDAGYSFKVEQLNASHAAEDLGLNVDASGGTITGRRLLSGLKTSLLSQLDGGRGLDDLGLLSLTDRSGGTANVDLSAAETVDDIIEVINTAGVGISARINDARNGILLTDTTGATTGNLIVANGDGTTTTADRLGIAIDAAITKKSSGSLRLQVVNENTLLSSYNGGGGVSQGTIRFTDNTGRSATLNIDGNTKTIGEVIDKIDQLGLALDARINEAGDGIVIVDKAGGGTTFKIEEGNGTVARDLRLLGEKTTIDINGTPTQVIDASTTFKLTLSATDTLQDLSLKINALNTRARSSIFSDGSSVKPYRFTLFNQNTGSAGEISFDTSEAAFTLDETIKAQDAVLQIGSPESGGVLAFSNTNEFKGLLPDVSLTVKGSSLTPVTVNVNQTDASLVTAVKDFVTSYNALRGKLGELTKYDSESNTAAILQGDARLLRVESDLNRLVSGRTFGAGQFQSLESLGISLKDDGTLKLDEEKLKAKFAESPEEIKQFFSKKDVGLSARFDKLIDQLAGIGESVLIGRISVLSRKIEVNTQRVNFFNARLEASRQKLTRSFERSELIISKLQSSLGAINSLSQFQFPQN